jgi:YbbR domain-containing protein
MKRPERDWKSWITDNGSYKLVALFVTLILWVTILGRGDIVMNKDVALEFLLPRNMAIADKIERKVAVKVSGPRMALKKFGQHPGTITVDLSRSRPGRTRAMISPKSVEVPFGVKVLSVTPDSIDVSLTPVGPEDGKTTDE